MANVKAMRETLTGWLQEWLEGLVAEASLEEVAPLWLWAIGCDACDGMDGFLEEAVGLCELLDALPQDEAKQTKQEKAAEKAIDDLVGALQDQVNSADEKRLVYYVQARQLWAENVGG